MLVRLFGQSPALVLYCFLSLVLTSGFLTPCLSEDTEPAEVYFFYDETQSVDEQSAQAIRMATESGFRIREVAANRFPRLAKMFQVTRLPSLILLRRSRLEGRHEGRFTFSRIREMFAKARENRLARRERIREFLAGNGRVRRMDAPTTAVPNSAAPIAPRYIPTSATVTDADKRLGLGVPKPLDRNGRFAVAHNPTPAEIKAFAATVRLRVVDPSGTSHGTGTIVHSTGNDALVLTCGHIFRESQGRGRIEADISFEAGKRTVGGKLISYDSKAHDIALLTIRTPYPIAPARLASQSFRGQLNQDVFTIGCDKGNQPTIRRSHFKRAARYDGTEKYDVFGRPIDGRSGGGLFNRQGELIGVCNAAAVHVDEGIYSGLKTIYHQLGVSHLVHLFDRSRGGIETQPATASRMLASSKIQTNSVRGQSDRSNAVQFQQLPPNPAIAFQSNANFGTGQSPTLDTRSMVPVNRSNQKLSPPPSIGFRSDESSLRNRSIIHSGQSQQPRIPSFRLADRL